VDEVHRLELLLQAKQQVLICKYIMNNKIVIYPRYPFHIIVLFYKAVQITTKNSEERVDGMFIT